MLKRTGNMIHRLATRYTGLRGKAAGSELWRTGDECVQQCSASSVLLGEEQACICWRRRTCSVCAKMQMVRTLTQLLLPES